MSTNNASPDCPATGCPVWADVVVSDIDRSADFYTAVLGFDIPPADPAFGGYRPAGVAGLCPQEMSPGSECIWDVHLSVDDVHPYADRVRELGGSAEDVMEMPPVGDFLTATTPTGARLQLYRPTPIPGTTGDGAPGTTVGHLGWAELVSTDVQADARFLAELFGAETRPMGENYVVVAVDGEPAFGVCSGVTREGLWRPYYLVASTDAAAEAAVSVGGRVLEGPFDSAFGRVAFIAGPDGETFAAIEPQ